MALIALGVCGGIGAYKAVEIARGLQKQGHDVATIMTRSATQFVGPVTFEAITRREVITDQWKPGANADIEHIALASSADLLLVAPATANVIGKFANGIADDFLSSLYLATTAPVLIAPAMNTNMFAHPAVVRNLDTLAARGVLFVDPGDGYLACGWIGKGRLAEPAEVVDAAIAVLRPNGPLSGKRLLITAGPTLEDIDPVRFVGNRSSGLMGYAIAAEASRRGARVTLISGPTKLAAPRAEEIIQVRSAAQMHEAVLSRAEHADVVVMAAAVADYTIATPDPHKIAKRDEPLTLTLTRTRDILGELGRLPSRLAAGRPVLVGFAAETHDVLAHARQKLDRKGADLIVANDVSLPGVGFDTSTNAVTLVSRDGAEDIPLQQKSAVAARLLDRVEQLLEVHVSRSR
ncbi:MAG TPA: bifunctional phosphopantothenoylcysteine decarboxylase/phosphopantothenate--cysteine ligase CoaBC [Vicinamibacterales bacterium]|nr:bifunctional phosphopantothenoylcysteine decarboxylase/phosphopantothenate--cysteine ligase CoaBC [Vicinamibacterales bacterium]